MAVTRERLRALFGLKDERLRPVSSSIDNRGDYVVERLTLGKSDGTMIRGFLTRPATVTEPRPAILYAHSHGGEYHIGADELLDGRTYLLDPLGPVFARAGYVTLVIDMPTFGDRSDVKESTATKALLWYGKSLLGQMLNEQAAALSYLQTRDDVAADRIGMFGISMGCTLGYFLAAADPRIDCVAQLCCFADIATLIELSAHDRHGIYMTIPGLLAETSSGDIAGMVAPRPQLICIGEADELTPPLAVERAMADVRAAYDSAGAPETLEVVSEPGIKHQETPRMREAMLRFFAKHLRGQ